MTFMMMMMMMMMMMTALVVSHHVAHYEAQFGQPTGALLLASAHARLLRLALASARALSLPESASLQYIRGEVFLPRGRTARADEEASCPALPGYLLLV